ncbi:hypothetical protein SAMN04489757_13312 [Anaerocolumna aminovalerica]|jgi:hypothetical protein|uniref:Uncharacterized protein n=1 Tax=Anaerocolumna aminovalerica TaxID=1527 RepID=A0A1I5HQE0_9FIRM|nr:hypothetical protein SAMN04489757_13312 [Anaerocolumna aminovalerica]
MSIVIEKGKYSILVFLINKTEVMVCYEHYSKYE